MEESKNKRDCIRCADLTKVDFIVDGRTYKGHAENMSRDGVFIKTESRFSKKQHISMNFLYPMFGTDRRDGKIARVATGGIGVRFNRPVYPR